MWVFVRIRVPFKIWRAVFLYALRHRIHPQLCWELIIDQGYNVLPYFKRNESQSQN